MALRIGQQAPDFTLPSTNGELFTLSKDMQGKPCILYFYPKDFTPVCTAEACSFRDNMEELKGLSIDVLGISRDSVEIHRKFQNEYELPFDLLADQKGEVCNLYDALVPIVKVPKRITYLLDKDHKIVQVVSNMFRADVHTKGMIESLKQGTI